MELDMKRFLLSLMMIVSFALAFADSKYYQGTTGSDIVLAIPEGHCTNIPAEQEYFMVLLQTQLTDTFNKFSPITVVDRQNESIADKEIANAENGSYSDKGYAEFGKKLNAQYVAIPNLIGKGIDYSLSIRIIKTEENKVYYSYNNNSVTATAIKNGTAINLAVKEILDQMGIMLTEAGKTAILGSVDTSTLKAQENLSKGINASKRGTTVEAMQYYYAAAEYNINNTEINQRLSQIQSAVSTGNIGDQVRGEQQIYDYWKKTLSEADTYFDNNPPFQIVYSTNIKYRERTTSELERGVVTLKINCGVFPNQSSQKAVRTLKQGVKESPKAIKDAFSSWPRQKRIQNNNNYSYSYSRNEWIDAENCTFTISIINDQDKVIGKSTFKGYNIISFDSDKDIDLSTFVKSLDTLSFENIDINYITDNLIIKVTEVTWEGKKIPFEKIKISTKEDLEEEIRAINEEKRRAELLIEAQKEKERKKAEAQKEKERKEARLNRNSGALNVECGINSFAEADAVLLTFDYNKAIKNSLFWGIEAGLGPSNIYTYADLETSDNTKFSFHTIGEIGYNVPLMLMTCIYTKAGIGFTLNHSSDGDSGLLLRAAAGIDWSLFTIQYALDYVPGHYFSDRVSIGLIWNSSILSRLEDY